MRDRGSVTMFSVMALVLAAVGLGLVYYGYEAGVAEEEALENAVEIEVEILETEIESRERTTTDDDFDDDSFDDQNRQEQETVYRPTVEFAYEFEGEEYRSSNIYPGGGTFQEYSDRSTAENELSPYSEGSVATGYVDPNDPGEAFLVREESGTPQMAMIVGGLFAVIGTVGFLIGRR